MQLRVARLCLDCEELYVGDTCPVCASDRSAFLSTWLPVEERRRWRRPAPRPAHQGHGFFQTAETPLRALVRGGDFGAGAANTPDAADDQCRSSTSRALKKNGRSRPPPPQNSSGKTAHRCRPDRPDRAWRDRMPSAPATRTPGVDNRRPRGHITLLCKVNVDGNYLDKPAIQVIRAAHLGMCFGVRDAIALAFEHAEKGPLTILGDLVHN